MAPASSCAPRDNGFEPLVTLCLALLACFAVAASAPVHLSSGLPQPASDAAAVPAMDLPILNEGTVISDLVTSSDTDLMSSSEVWTAEIAHGVSVISSTTGADDRAAAVQAAIQPLVQYASVQGMMGTLLTAAQAAVDAAADAVVATDDMANDAVVVITEAILTLDGPWPIADDADEHLMPELLDHTIQTETGTAAAADSSNSDGSPESSVDDVVSAWASHSAMSKWGSASRHQAMRSMSLDHPKVQLQADSLLETVHRRSLQQTTTTGSTTPATITTTTSPSTATTPTTATPTATTTTPTTTTTTTPTTPTTTTPTTTTSTPTTTTTTAPAATSTTTPTTTSSTATTTPTTTPATPTTTTTPGTTTASTTTTPTTSTTTSPSSPVTTAPGTTVVPGSSSPETPAVTVPEASPAVPAQPTDVQPGEAVPAEVQQQVDTTKTQTQTNSALVVPSAQVTVSFVLKGTSASGFESVYRQTVLKSVSTVSGTSADQWTVSTAEQSASGRRLMQGTNLKVDLSILTVNPTLVVFRLAKPPANSTSSCKSELCAQLSGSGVPVDQTSVRFAPDAIYSSLFGTSDQGQTGNPEADVLQKRRDLGKIVGLSIAGGVLLALLAINYKRFIACYRSRRAVSAQKKHLKQQQKLGTAAGVKSDSGRSASDETSRKPQVLGDPITIQASPQRSTVVKTLDGSVSDDSSSRISVGGGQAAPWVNGLAPQQEILEEVMPSMTPVVHYYQSNGDEVTDRPTFYLQRGNTLGDEDRVNVADQENRRHNTTAAVPIYHADSDSFKIWADQSAAAAAAAASGSGATQRHTPASSSVVDMAAMLPGSPISSPLHSTNNSHSNLHHLTGTAQYPVDPLAIQQTLQQLQYLMQQQQQMVAMMGSAAAPGMPADSQIHPASPAGTPSYSRISNPGFDQGFSGGRCVDVGRQVSSSAPGSRSGTPEFASPAGTPTAAASLQRAGGFTIRDVGSSGPSAGARISKMDGSRSGNSSRRMRAVSQHGHQDMLPTPFANPALPYLYSE